MIPKSLRMKPTNNTIIPINYAKLYYLRDTIKIETFFFVLRNTLFSNPFFFSFLIEDTERLEFNFRF